MNSEKIKAALDHQINDVKWYGEEGQKALDALRSILPLLEAQTSAGEEIPRLNLELEATQIAYENGDLIFTAIHEAARRYAASQQTRGEVAGYKADQVCEEICRIMKEYDRQISVRGYVDTPGGLENMGDVWNLLRSWQYLLTPPVAGKDRGE